MIFTQEQINEIKQRLALSGSKDLQLPLADLPLSGEETIALVQQGENKRVSIEEFYEEFSQYIDGSERQEAKDIAQNTAQSASSMENIVGVLKEQGEQDIATVLEHEARIKHNEQDIAKLQEQLGLLLRQAE